MKVFVRKNERKRVHENVRKSEPGSVRKMYIKRM